MFSGAIEKQHRMFSGGIEKQHRILMGLKSTRFLLDYVLIFLNIIQLKLLLT